MVKVGKCALMHKKWTFRVELTKKTSHCKSRDFLRKRRLKIATSLLKIANLKSKCRENTNVANTKNCQLGKFQIFCSFQEYLFKLSATKKYKS